MDQSKSEAAYPEPVGTPESGCRTTFLAKAGIRRCAPPRVHRERSRTSEFILLPPPSELDHDFRGVAIL